MALSNFYLTDRGNALMAQTLTGSTITITRAQIGEGTWPDGTTFANVAALVAPIKDLAIARKRADSNGQTIITVQFSTAGIGRAFNWSEFALWAADPASPGDRSKDFILGTSRAIAAEEAVHFDAVQEEFNFNVILKTSSADSVEIIFEGSTVYPSLDPDGGLTLEGGLQVAGGQGAFVADVQSTIVEHRKDGDRFGFVVYPDMPITERYKIFDDVDGVIRQYEILHTGVQNITEKIGAVRAKPLGSYGAETTIAEQVQYWFDQHIRWGIFHAALCADLPPETINWDHGVEFKVLSGYRVEVTATALNALTFIRHYDAYTKLWANDWVSSNAWDATELPDGADLNDYKEPGRYYKISGADAFLNTPTAYGSIALIVERTGAYGVGVIQTVKDHKGNVYTRSYAAESDSDWTPWGWSLASNRNGLLNVPSNGGYRIKNTDTGAASDFMAGRGYTVMRIMDTFDDNNNYREIMLVGANESPDKAHAVRLLDVVNGVGTSYTIYHEGNAPAVTATAELI